MRASFRNNIKLILFVYSYLCRKSYYCLSFEYVFRGGEEEEISFAYCPPYTYSKLNRFIASLHEKNQTSPNFPFLKQERLCLSMSGLEVPLLTITGTSENKCFAYT